MNADRRLVERLTFLARVARKECNYLQTTDVRLFAAPFTPGNVSRLETDVMLAEQVEASVSRFGRLQDTLGDKLLPALLEFMGEAPAPLLDNMHRAEKWGWIDSVDDWIAMRQLRNQMVHEYIEDPVILSSALNAGHAFVPALLVAAERLLGELGRRLGVAIGTPG